MRTSKKENSFRLKKGCRILDSNNTNKGKVHPHILTIGPRYHHLGRRPHSKAPINTKGLTITN